MRAQVTLETIIMLVVLLVLAGVMITLILNIKPPASPQKFMSKQEFLSKGESYCNDPDKVVEYCRLYWDGNDWNENKIPYENITVGAYNWYACEDRIYCFLVKPCDRLGSGLDLLKKCKDILCGVYLDKYGGDVNLATLSLLRDIGFSKKCSLSSAPPEENWYDKVFKNGCEASTSPESPGGPGGPPGGPPSPPGG